MTDKVLIESIDTKNEMVCLKNDLIEAIHLLPFKSVDRPIIIQTGREKRNERRKNNRRKK